MISQERLAILTVVFTLALGVSLTLSPGVALPYGAALALLAAVSVPYLLHTHPAYKFSPLRIILPAAIALAAPSIARSLAGSFTLVGVFGPPALLYACVYAEYQAVRPSATDRARAGRLILTLSAYVVALSFFLLIYQVKQRSLISGTAAAAVSGGLALRLFTLDRRQDWRTNLYAFLVAVGMGEVLWPLNYWILGIAAGGVALLLAFYVFVGVMRQLLAGQLSPQVLLEYGSVALTGTLAIAIANRF
ncbi:MAG: hypothetical protein KGJ86_03785 [Chloroflexota bacterium]|nr:hypothetical protein [Chloroflexota bacterium]